MVKVLHFDPNNAVLQKVNHLLLDVKNLTIVSQTTKLEEATENAVRFRPDIMLLPLHTPRTQLISALHKIRRANNPELKIIGTMTIDEKLTPQSFVFAGIQGYITQPASADELIEAIHKVHAGGIYLLPEIAHKALLYQLQTVSHAPFVNLSNRELQIMLLLVRGISPVEIGQKLFLSPKTVNTYRYRLFEKLNVQNNVMLTHLALRYGMVENA